MVAAAQKVPDMPPAENKDDKSEKKKVEKEEAKTRRRETFDFDLWSGDSSAAAESKKLPQSEWINWETKVHTDTGQ